VLEKARREEQEAIDPPFDRSLDLLPKLATGACRTRCRGCTRRPEDEGEAQGGARSDAPALKESNGKGTKE
jgi:hypothetical protein